MQFNIRTIIGFECRKNRHITYIHTKWFIQLILFYLSIVCFHLSMSLMSKLCYNYGPFTQNSHKYLAHVFNLNHNSNFLATQLNLCVFCFQLLRSDKAASFFCMCRQCPLGRTRSNESVDISSYLKKYH